MAATFSISISAQLRAHLRALRKRKGMTQAQLGELAGVSQARIAEIEANPGVVNLDQLLQLLSLLDASLRVHMEDDASPAGALDASGVAERQGPAYTPADDGHARGKKWGSW